MPQLSKRVDTFTESVIRRMTRISDAREGSINLSQGFPDFDPPQALLEALAQMAGGGEQHQYSITFGSENLRNCIAKKYSPIFGYEIDPETEIVVTCGSTEAMMAAMMTICNPGDKVIVFSPFYENYGADAILSGADPIYVPLNPPEFGFDRSVLEAAFAKGAKAIIVCNPSNPCGKVFSREELEYILELAEKYDAFVITDEVYEHIVFPPYQHIAAASLLGGRERVITCNSLSKTFSITGWRLAETYGKKRKIFMDGLDAIGLKHTVPQGSYFIMVDISDFLKLEKFQGWTDLQFCEWMVEEVGVAAVPGSSFFREPINHLIRLHFARSEDSLREALSRLSKLADYLKA